MKKTIATLMLATLALAGTAYAQDYPTKPITVVVPFSAGGPTDTVARLVAEAMSQDLGQQVVVQNVGGAGGTLGAGRSRPHPMTAIRCCCTTSACRPRRRSTAACPTIR